MLNSLFNNGVAVKPKDTLPSSSQQQHQVEAKPASPVSSATFGTFPLAVSTALSKTSASNNPSNVSKAVPIFNSGTVVSFPNVSGYEIRVTYVSTSSSTVTSNGEPIQSSSVPMKKRPYVAAFSNSVTEPTKSAASDKTIHSTTSKRDHPHMTSLYVGASPSLLGLSSGGLKESTSDNESEREHPSPMFKIRNITTSSSNETGQYHHWRKKLVNERSQKDWHDYQTKPSPDQHDVTADSLTELRAKQLKGFHSYDPSKTGTSASQKSPLPSHHELLTKTNESPNKANDGSKAVYTLWNKRHHASKICW